jgi:Leucine-rich repeat (LRR) protein
MERESIPTLAPPADVSQPLLTPDNTVTDENEGKGVGVVLRTFSQIPANAITNINDSNDPHSTQSVLLPTSGSIQVDVIECTESDKEEIPAEYQSLADDNENNALFKFLESLGITRQQIDHAQIPKLALLKLYQQEFSCFSGMKWSSLDHAIEKNLQWPLLSPADVGFETPQKCDYRVRPHERTILLKTTWGLIKAYAVRGFVQGVEMGLLESVHYFIYAMLAYRLRELAKTGQSSFEEFQSIFSGFSQKGIDSLVHSLAGLESLWLKLILAAPVIFGVGQSIVKMRGARPISADEIKKIGDKINRYLAKPSGFWQSIFLEEIFLLSNLLSLGSQVRKLEQWVRWDGRFDDQSRKQAFEFIRRVAWNGNKMTQLNALKSLAKIAHGIGLKDFPRLQRAGYSPEELTGLLYIKAKALADLEDLSQSKSIEEKRLNEYTITRKLAPVARRLYASYLLWWLGQSTSWWTQRLPFFLFKIMKLGLEVLFLQKIAASILESINCPDKPGFQFGNGYQDWASDYTAECFTKRINYFRTLDVNESVDDLIAEIPQYHLNELTTLSLNNKYLTHDEATQIIQAVVRQGSLLQTIDLSENSLITLRNGMFTGLSNLEELNLSLAKLKYVDSDIFSNLRSLKILNLGWNSLISFDETTLSNLVNLQSLLLFNNNIKNLSSNIFSSVGQLKELHLGDNELSNLDENIFTNLLNLVILDLSGNQFTTFNVSLFDNLRQLETLRLYFNPLNVLDKRIFSNLINLTELDLSECQFQNLSGGIFEDLVNLQMLDLSVNPLIYLADDIFLGLNNLQNLQFQSSQLLFLNPIPFYNLTNLKTLNLYHNFLVNINPNVFINLTNLQELSLESNLIDTDSLISISASLPRNLTSLQINSNIIRSIPENFGKLLPASLSTLYISDNPCIPTVLTREFMKYFPLNITILDFSISSRNPRSYVIEGIAAEAFLDFPFLQKLDIRNNELTNIDSKAFSGLKNLQELLLGTNNISELSDGVFSDLSNLIRLEISDNQLPALKPEILKGLSKLQILDLMTNKLTSPLTEELFANLTYLEQLSLGYSQFSIINKGAFKNLNRLQFLLLDYNQLNDTAINNMTVNFPEQISTLGLSGNQIGNAGLQSLGNILACTNITDIRVDHNPANDTSLALQAQNNALKKVCDDQRCHANLPAAESCGVSINPSITGQMIWGLFGRVNEIDKAESNSSDYYWSLPAETLSFPPDLILPGTTSEFSSLLLTTKTAGAIILGVTGLSILFYKNCTWMQAIVNTGSCFFRRCWNGEKTKEVKMMISPVNLSNRRYALFPHLLTSSTQRVSTCPSGKRA